MEYTSAACRHCMSNKADGPILIGESKEEIRGQTLLQHQETMSWDSA